MIVNYNGEPVEQSSSLGFVLLLGTLLRIIPLAPPLLAPLLSLAIGCLLVALSAAIASKYAPGLGLPTAWLPHHMGGCRMGTNPDASVVDSFGRVHGVTGLLVAGGAMFPVTSGAVNPTLTMTALAFRTSDYILDQSL